MYSTDLLIESSLKLGTSPMRKIIKAQCSIYSLITDFLYAILNYPRLGVWEYGEMTVSSLCRFMHFEFPSTGIAFTAPAPMNAILGCDQFRSYYVLQLLRIWYITTWPGEYAIYMVDGVISISANIYGQLVPVHTSLFLLLDMSPSFDLVEFLVLFVKPLAAWMTPWEVVHHEFRLALTK